jgi:hypothetical protein
MEKVKTKKNIELIELREGLKKTRSLLVNYHPLQIKIKMLTDNIRRNESIIKSGEFDRYREMFIVKKASGAYTGNDIVLKTVCYNETMQEMGKITDKQIAAYFQLEIKRDISSRTEKRSTVKMIKTALKGLHNIEYMIVDLFFFSKMSVADATHNFNNYSDQKYQLSEEGIKKRKEKIEIKLYNSMKGNTDFRAYKIL